MTGNEYQNDAMRTNDKRSSKRVFYPLMNSMNNDQMPIKRDIGGILNASLGLSGEVGEFNDMIKKWLFHEKPLTAEEEFHLKKELGDILWYVALMADSFGWDLDSVMELNIDKLKNRYPEGFDTLRANKRKVGDV